MSNSDLVLVTGASGFLGAAIADAVRSRGLAVRGLVRHGSPTANLNPMDQVWPGDLLDPSALRRSLEGVRYVIHAAADYRLWARDPNAVLRTNVEGTRNLMRACLDAGTERIVFTSSVATLAPSPTGLADESHRLDPGAAYGVYERSKILSERLVERMIYEHGLPAVIVQPATIIGPRDIRPTPTGRMILEAARGRVPAFVKTGLTVAHVEDVAEGHILALERGDVGQRYILGGDPVELQTLLAGIAALTGRKAPWLQVPRWLAYAAACGAELAAGMTGREPLTTRTGVKLSRHFMYFSDAKARAALGYQPRPYSIALEDAISWFVQVGHI